MTFYIILFLIVLFFTLLSIGVRNRIIEKTTAFTLCFGLIIIGTIRWKTGYDWVFYHGFYVYIRDHVTVWQNLKVTFEPIFTSFYFLAKYSGVGFVLVQFLQIFFIIILKYSVLKRYTPYVVLGLFLNFCFFPDIVTVRNFFAASVVLYGLKYVEQRKPLKFFWIILIASNIHISSVLAILYYPLYHKNYSIKFKSVLLVIAVGIGLTGILDSIFGLISGSLGGDGRIATKLNHYSDNIETSAANNADPVILVLGIVRRLLIMPIIFYYEHKYFSKDKLFKGVSNLFVFGNILYFIVGNGGLMILQRFSIPFYLTEVLLLVWMYEKSRIKPLFFCFLMLYGFSKYYYIYSTAITVRPYIHIFNPDAKSEYWEEFKPEGPFPNK